MNINTFYILCLIVFVLFAAFAMINLIIDLVNTCDYKGYLYIDEGSEPNNIYLELIMDVDELKKKKNVVFRIDKINSRK